FGRLPTSGIAVADGVTVRDAVAALLERLNAEGVRHVYCTDPMLQWTIMWQSRERIHARWVHPTDRVPEHPAAVDRALFSGQRGAVIGAANEAGALADALRAAGRPRDPIIVAGSFSLALDPGTAAVRHLGFGLNE